jgi:hypothetical protein
MLVLALYVNKVVGRPSAQEMNQFRGNGFTSSKERDEFAAPKNGEYQSVTTPFNFELNSPPSAGQLRLTFKYNCGGPCPQLWLTMDTKPEGIPIRLLVHHPSLESHPMPSISDGVFTLYQKNVTYPTIEAFVHNPPSANEVVAVDQVIAAYLPKPITNLYYSENLTADTSPDYWLTTFLRPRIFFDWYEFSRAFYPENARKNEKGTIQFTLESYPPNTEIMVTEPTVSVSPK